MKVGYTANIHNAGGRRDGDSRSDDSRLGEFVLLARFKVTNRFNEESVHVAQ
jgi:hypothetical protein